MCNSSGYPNHLLVTPHRTHARTHAAPQPTPMSTHPPLQDKLQHVVVNASGFSWAPDKPEARTWEEQKWGWSASEIGDWAELVVDTRDVRQVANGSDSSGGSSGGGSNTTHGAAAGSAAVAATAAHNATAPAANGTASAAAAAGGAGSNETTTIYLGYLKSYTGMGLATVDCVSGCNCSVGVG